MPNDIERLRKEMNRANKRWKKKKTHKNKVAKNRAQAAYDRAKTAQRYDSSEFDFYISEHAALRFIQRRMDIDLDEVRALMVKEIDFDAIDALGPGKYPMSEGGRIVVAPNGTVVTYIDS
jgi:hypothetical protein